MYLFLIWLKCIIYYKIRLTTERSMEIETLVKTYSNGKSVNNNFNFFLITYI